MTTLRLTDIIEPSVYLRYMQLFSTEKNAFVRSGIMAAPPEEVQSQMNAGGATIDMPFWNDLTRGVPDIMSDDPDTLAVPDKISTGKDVAVKHYWHKSWSNMDLSSMVATGDRNDPVRVVTEGMAEWWMAGEQRMLVATLNGVFADNAANDSDDMTYSVYSDIASPTAANKISPQALHQTRLTAGDAIADFVAIAVHSKVYGDMLDAEDIDFKPDSETPWDLGFYMNRMVIVDDQMPVSTGYTNTPQYTSYLFGRGSIAKTDGMLDSAYAFERDRTPAAGNGGGQTVIHTRRHTLMHPRGVKFLKDTMAGKSPTDVELALAANWDRVYDRKLIRLAALYSN